MESLRRLRQITANGSHSRIGNLKPHLTPLQIYLPVELWLEISDLISRPDVKSLSCCCRSLRSALLPSLVHHVDLVIGSSTSNSPSQISGIRHLLPLVNHVDYNFSPPKSKKIGVWLMANIRIMYGAYYHLNALKEMTSLRTITMSNLFIHVHPQRRILSLPSLRNLTCSNMDLLPGKLDIPQPSNLENLRIDRTTTLHSELVHWVAPNLVKLDCRDLAVETWKLIFEPQYPLLTTLFLAVSTDGFHQELVGFLERCTALQRLTIYSTSLIILSSDALPSLTYVNSYALQAAHLFGDRPKVKDVTMYEDYTGKYGGWDSEPFSSIERELFIDKAHVHTDMNLEQFVRKAEPLFRNLLHLRISINTLCASQARGHTNTLTNRDCHCKLNTRIPCLRQLISFRLDHVDKPGYHERPKGEWSKWVRDKLAPSCPRLERVLFGVYFEKAWPLEKKDERGSAAFIYCEIMVDEENGLVELVEHRFTRREI